MKELQQLTVESLDDLFVSVHQFLVRIKFNNEIYK